jgi:hypothetical protein
MKSDNLSIEQAINDLSTIKRAIEISSPQEGVPKNFSALSVGRISHLFGIAIAGSILTYEIFAETSLTEIMLLSKIDPDVGISGLALVAMILPVLILCLYFVIWRESASEGDTFQHYVSRNFRYLKNLGFVSDVICKFVPVSLLVLCGGAEWVAPLLILFLGDFLIGGKYFIVPVKTGILTGVICVIIAISQWIQNSSSLILPLSVFISLSLISIAFTFKNNK